MNTFTKAITTTAAAALILITTTACDKGKNNSNNTSSNQSTTAASRPAWLLDTEPANAIPVGELKATAQEGDAVVVLARIGGRMTPITVGSPVFTVVDLKLLHCGQLPDDHCSTPWDYCCEPRESLAANTATVHIQTPAPGAPTPDPSTGGLSPLDEVVIVGTVGPRPNPTVLTINATSVYRRTN